MEEWFYEIIEKNKSYRKDFEVKKIGEEDSDPAYKPIALGDKLHKIEEFVVLSVTFKVTNLKNKKTKNYTLKLNTISEINVMYEFASDLIINKYFG